MFDPFYYKVLSQMVLVVMNLPTNAEDIRNMGLIPGLGRSPGGGHGNPLHHSCLENFFERGAWQAAVHRVTQSQTWLKQLIAHAHSTLLLYIDIPPLYIVIIWKMSHLFEDLVVKNKTATNVVCLYNFLYVLCIVFHFSFLMKLMDHWLYKNH